MRYYSYEEFLKDCFDIAKRVEKDFDAYLAVARGGLTFAHFLAEFTNQRELLTINALGYEEDRKRESLTLYNIPNLEKFDKILIIDDIVDSGRTLKELLKLLKEKYPKKAFKSAALLYKESALVEPDYYAKQADEWIDFFWTRDLYDIDD